MDSDKQIDLNGQFEILPNLTPQQQAKMQREYRQKLSNFYGKNKKYQIDYWYPVLKQYTYTSFYFSITIIEGYLLHSIYYDEVLSEELLGVKNKLIERINTFLLANKNNNNNGKYFMKLSTRSPKDYCWDYRNEQQFTKAVENLKKYLIINKINQNIPIDQLNNLLYKFFLINSHQKLMIQSGLDFIRIFSKSQRIITDINDFSYIGGGLFQKIKENKIQEVDLDKALVNVWVRDWDNCKWQQQFRTFFYNYKLTGITQYDQKCFFPGLVSKKEEITKRCLQIFSKIKPKLIAIELDKGVLDFAIQDDSIKIIQINVFDRDARASLFNWNQDQKVMMNGPLQIRVLDKQVQISKNDLGSIMGMIDKKSIDVITMALQEIGLLNIWL